MLRGSQVARAIVLAMLSLVGCGDDGGKRTSDGNDDEPDAGPKPSIAIGIADAERGILFVPLQPGDDVTLETRGQGGMHATFVIQVIGFGIQAWTDITMRNLGDYDGDAGVDFDGGVDGNPDMGQEVSTTMSHQPPLLACMPLTPPVYCRTFPRILMTGGLTRELDELPNLHVEVEVNVRNRDGLNLTATTDVFLRAREQP